MRRALGILAVVVVALAVWTGRILWAGEAELRASDVALERGDANEAIVRARRAASLYAPGAPHVADAFRRLTALAVAAEEHHRRDVALFAWRGIRQAALDGRWVVVPHAADRARADREIARLVALGSHDRAAPDPDVEARHLALLARDERAHPGWVGALLGGLAAAGAGLSVAVRRAAVAGRFDWTRSRAPLLVALVGALVWSIACFRA